MQTVHPSYSYLSPDSVSSIVSNHSGYLARHLEETIFTTHLHDARDWVDHKRAEWLDAQRGAE